MNFVQVTAAAVSINVEWSTTLVTLFEIAGTFKDVLALFDFTL